MPALLREMTPFHFKMAPIAILHVHPVQVDRLCCQCMHVLACTGNILVMAITEQGKEGRADELMSKYKQDGWVSIVLDQVID